MQLLRERFRNFVTARSDMVLGMRRNSEAPNTSQVLDALWPLLWIGKIFGLIPLVKSSAGGVSFSYRSLCWALCVYSWLTYFTIFIFAVIIFWRELKGIDANLVEQFLDMVYHLHITATITFCIYESRNFPELFEEWSSFEARLNRLETLVDFKSCLIRTKAGSKSVRLLFNRKLPFYNVVEKVKADAEAKRASKFVLNCWFLTGGYFTLTIIGALAYFVGIGVREETETFSDYLIEVAKVYILEEHCVWWTGFYVLIIGHIMEIAWAYGDMLILHFSYAMGRIFLRFNTMLEIIRLNEPSSEEIEHLRELHWELAIAIKKTDARLGLITTTTFVFNILYLFSRVYLGLAEDLSSSNYMIVFEASYAFTYLVLRIFGSAVCASKLNEESNRTLVILKDFYPKRCSETYYLMMDRFCNQVITGNVALTGNSYFILNRNFIASLVSAIVTYEVIIIQFSSS